MQKNNIMPVNQNPLLLDKVFRTGVVIKGITAVFEFLAGFIIYQLIYMQQSA